MTAILDAARVNFGEDIQTIDLGRSRIHVAHLRDLGAFVVVRSLKKAKERLIRKEVDKIRLELARMFPKGAGTSWECDLKKFSPLERRLSVACTGVVHQ
ncbi:MAG: hypothetical protein ACTSU5_14385 [Promethearchaeota archaeon]